MSIDGVDDLHAAEDRIGALQEVLARIAEDRHSNTVTGHAGLAALCGDPLCRQAREAAEPFVRPTCEDRGFDCDDTCGGHHPARAS